MKNVFAILNPAAGGGQCKKLGLKAIDELMKAGWSVELAETKAAGQGLTIAKDAYRAGYSQFISIGGDGTHHEILNGLFPLANDQVAKPMLSFLPFGTGNSFMREFMPNPKLYGVSQLLKAKEQDCDVIRLIHDDGEIHFINLFGIGFVADVGLCRNAYFKRFGKLGYVLATLLKTMQLQSQRYSLQIDEQTEIKLLTTFLCINNSRYTGGNMLMAPHAKINDGWFDVIHVKKINRYTLIKIFPQIFSGEHVKTPHVHAYKAKSMQFKFDKAIPVMIDGEITRINPIKLEVLSGKLRVRI